MDKYDILGATMCAKKPGQNYHNLECIERRCELCGVDKLNFVIPNNTSKALKVGRWIRIEDTASPVAEVASPVDQEVAPTVDEEMASAKKSKMKKEAAKKRPDLHVQSDEE
jgi:hypothetical protein